MQAPETTPALGQTSSRPRPVRIGAARAVVVSMVAMVSLASVLASGALVSPASATTGSAVASAADAASATPASNPPPSPPGGAGGGGGGGVPEGYFSRSRVWEATDSPPVSGCLGACRARESGIETHYSAKCRGGNRWGPWEGVEGFEEGRYDYKPGQGRTPGHTWYSAATYDCISAAAWTETPVQCVISYTTRAVGPLNNPQVAQDTRLLHDREPTAFAEAGKTKPVLCERSRTLPVGTRLDHYGAWKIKASRRVATCTLFTYIRADVRTKKMPPNRIGECVTLPADTVSAKAQVFCERPGWTRDWSGTHAYTPQDCLTHPGGVWDCGSPSGAPRLDGRPATPANIVNDGADHSLRWAPPAPRGEVRAVHEDRVRLSFLGGTPHRSGVSTAADTQPFVVNPTVDDWVYGWAGMGESDGTDFVVNFQAASVAGRPWTAAPDWVLTADFGKTIPRVETIDAFTADFAASSVYDWERLVATCTGAAAEVSVFAPRQH